MTHISTKTIELGEVKSTDIVPFTINWTGPTEDMLYYYKGCGSCTSLKFDPEGGKFDGTLTIGNTGFQRTEGTISKNVTIYINDGEPEFVPNPQGMRVPNPKKKKYSVQIKAQVKD